MFLLHSFYFNTILILYTSRVYFFRDYHYSIVQMRLKNVSVLYLLFKYLLLKFVFLVPIFIQYSSNDRMAVGIDRLYRMYYYDRPIDDAVIQNQHVHYTRCYPAMIVVVGSSRIIGSFVWSAIRRKKNVNVCTVMCDYVLQSLQPDPI